MKFVLTLIVAMLVVSCGDNLQQTDLSIQGVLEKAREDIYKALILKTSFL